MFALADKRGARRNAPFLQFHLKVIIYLAVSGTMYSTGFVRSYPFIHLPISSVKL